MIDIFIPSYHRPNNLKTIKMFLGLGWQPKRLHVFIDSEADDKVEYEETCSRLGINLHVFDMREARMRYDYIHRPSKARRSAGQARNMFQDFAKENGIDFYCVQDDDSQFFEIKDGEGRRRTAKDGEVVRLVFDMVEEFMRRRKVGVFGLSQSGDLIGYDGVERKVFRPKVMNTTFYLLPYIYRGERGVQDDDTSMFVGIYNEGLFTGSLAYGIVLHQTPSAKAKGGLTDLYEECKLLNKAMVCPIQFPSAIYGERQEMNGGRLHHHILNRNLMPRILRIEGGRDNIAWDTFPEDWPFTNESKIDNKNE